MSDLQVQEHPWQASRRSCPALTNSGHRFSTCGELVTLTPEPRANTLRRVFGWQPLPQLKSSRASLAYHEAGHVVFLEWLGIDPQGAEIGAQGGLTHLPQRNAETPQSTPDLDGINTAVGAGVFHAGLVAEMLFQGHKPPTGPVRYTASDFDRAEAMLSDCFGARGSGPHYFAQRFAWHVLSHRWERVGQVAQHLVKYGWFGRPPTLGV